MEIDLGNMPPQGEILGIVSTYLTQKYQITGLLEHNDPFAATHFEKPYGICPNLPLFTFLFAKLFLRIKYFQNAPKRFYAYMRKFYEKKQLCLRPILHPPHTPYITSGSVYEGGVSLWWVEYRLVAR